MSQWYDDAALVVLVCGGEREAFEPLLLRVYPGVLRLCQRLLGSTQEAQDIAQEAALQAFLGLAELHEPARFRAWVHAIAANLARTALRHRHTISLDQLADRSSGLVIWAGHVPSPEDAFAMREIHDRIVQTLMEYLRSTVRWWWATTCKASAMRNWQH